MFYRTHLLFVKDDNSIDKGLQEVLRVLNEELVKYGLEKEIGVLQTGSLGYISKGVHFVVYPDNLLYTKITQEDIPLIVQEHFLKGRPVKRLCESAKRDVEFAYSERIVLKNSGKIDPESIDEYIAVDGYQALGKAFEMGREATLQEIKKSNLRGRGGAGFPTGIKMEMTANQSEKQKYIVVNADEGESGTFKDRLIMEGDPHKLLEGMVIAGFVVRADTGYIYIRGEYSLCVQRLKIAIEQAHNYGLLGKNILGSGFDFDVIIKLGAGSYVCGEETALLNSLEGGRGNPRFKPPYPGERGLWNKPTVINNVETLTNIPAIVEKGGEWFAGIGTPESCGTKVYTILGEVNNPGLIEVPMGTTLREIISKYGGGLKADKKFKAALVGGAAGMFLPERLLDIKMDFENLSKESAVLGSGAILILSEDADILRILTSILKFFLHESCGKCSACRIGYKMLVTLLDKIVSGEGKSEDIDKMVEIANVMRVTSFCALGQSSIMPIGSIIKYFKGDFKRFTGE